MVGCGLLKVGIFFLFVFPPPRPSGTEVGTWGEGRHEHGLVAVPCDDFQKCVNVDLKHWIPSKTTAKMNDLVVVLNAF